MSGSGFADDADLDAELSRLFADDRLGVRPKDDASLVIAAGARRVRRRRTMLASGGTAAAVVALVGGALVLNDPSPPGDVPNAQAASPEVSERSTIEGTPLAGPPSAQPQRVPGASGARAIPEGGEPRSVPTRSLATRPPMATVTAQELPDLGPALGPDGYRTLALGMSYQEAESTGMLARGQEPPQADGCSVYRSADGESGIKDVTISPGEGIVRFRAENARTPEGIGTGSSLDQVRAAYPDLSEDPSGYTASAGNAALYYFIVTDDVVTEVELRARTPDC